MKYVWVLEKYQTADKLREMIKDFDDGSFNKEFSEEVRKTFGEASLKLHEALAKNPDGRWVGWQGKTNYKQFCEVAKASLNSSPKDKYRVVKAELDDDAEYWVGYKNGVINEGVMKYLWATRKYA